MKLFLIFFFSVSVFVPWVQKVEADPTGKGFEEIAGGIDLPAQNWQTAYPAGGAGKVCIGYEFKDGVALQFDLELLSFSGTNYAGPISDTEVLALPTIRRFLANKGLRPYVSAGLGMDLEISSASNSNSTVENLDAALGAGLDIPLPKPISPVHRNEM